MGENTTKKKVAKRNKWNVAVIKEIVKLYGVSEYFIRESLRGDKKSLTSDAIVKDYNRLCKVQEEAFNKALTR
jgi:hypothetical protein